MKPEGEGWITAREAAPLLGVREDYVKNLVYRGELTPWSGCRKPFYYRLEEVQALAESVERQFRKQRLETRQKRRVALDPAEGMPRVGGLAMEADLISTSEAVRILGISRISVGILARSGMLACYQARPGKMGSRLWFLRSEVEQRAKMRDCMPETMHIPLPKRLRKRYVVRQKRKHVGRIEVGDLPMEERFIAEWATARQAAWILNVSISTIHQHRVKGHLRAEKWPVQGRRCQWFFWRKGVTAMLNNRKYNAARYRWEQYLSPQAKVEREAQEMEDRLREAEAARSQPAVVLRIA